MSSWDLPDGCRLNDPRAPWNGPDLGKLAEGIEDEIRTDPVPTCCGVLMELAYEDTGVWYRCGTCGETGAGHSFDEYEKLLEERCLEREASMREDR